MERSLITDMPRDKYVERCKQRAFDYLDRGDFKNAVASFVSNERPSGLRIATLLGNAWRCAANGERCARLEDADRRIEVMVG
jgi:hypothetical protein